MKETIKLEEIKKPGDFKKFALFPFTLYKKNPYWVPPLIKAELDEMTPGINPAFEHCESIYLIAYKDGKAAGRIAGIINHRYNQLWNKNVARFYWFDFIDDNEVSGTLISAVEKWAISKGIDGIVGPMGFTTFERQGILVEGFDKLPTIASVYNYEYYAENLEKNGYVKDHDYIEYLIRVPDHLPERSASLAELVSKRYSLHVLQVRSKKELMKYSLQVFDVINAAYRLIEGFVPLTEKQVLYFLKKYDPIIQPDFTTAILDENDRMVGFQIAMPSLSKAFQKANGKMLPFGFYHIARALKNPKAINLLLVGVIPEYQNKGVNAFFLNEITKTCIAKHIATGESNGMLEDNFKILNFTRYYDVVLHKRRRLFFKDLNA